MSNTDIKNSIRNIPDFPCAGIQFKDISTAIKQPQIFKKIVDDLASHFANYKIDYIAGIESRGFIFASPLAYLLNCGFIMIRKPNKLPAETICQEYGLEYGKDKIEIHKDAIEEGKNVLLIDDLLATGGTAQAAIDLIKKTGGNVVGTAFVVKLNELNGEKNLHNGGEIYSVVEF